MSIFERSVTCSFFQELYSHIDKNSGEKFEDMFLVKLANKGTSLSYYVIPRDVQLNDGRTLPGAQKKVSIKNFNSGLFITFTQSNLIS